MDLQQTSTNCFSRGSVGALLNAATVVLATLFIGTAAAQVIVDGRDDAVVVRGHADRAAYTSARKTPVYRDPWAAAPSAAPVAEPAEPRAMAAGGSGTVLGTDPQAVLAQATMVAVLAASPASPSAAAALTVPVSLTSHTGAALHNASVAAADLPRRGYSQAALGVPRASGPSTADSTVARSASSWAAASTARDASLASSAEVAVWSLEPWSQRRYHQSWPRYDRQLNGRAYHDRFGHGACSVYDPFYGYGYGRTTVTSTGTFFGGRGGSTWSDCNAGYGGFHRHRGYRTATYPTWYHGYGYHTPSYRYRDPFCGPGWSSGFSIHIRF